MTDQTPMPTVLGDPLPGFVPMVWMQACHETEWATKQLQGFIYNTGPDRFCLVVRDVGRPPEQQVLWREDFEARTQGDSGYPHPQEPAYVEGHVRMHSFIAEQQLLTIAERYRVLRRALLAKGVV